VNHLHDDTRDVSDSAGNSRSTMQPKLSLGSKVSSSIKTAEHTLENENYKAGSLSQGSGNWTSCGLTRGASPAGPLYKGNSPFLCFLI